MDKFMFCIKGVLGNEGGYSNNKDDRGGETNFGLSAKFIRSFGSKYDFNKNGFPDDDIKDLTEDQAILIYRNEFWDAGHYEKIENWRVCYYLLDAHILHGLGNCAKIAQRALWATRTEYRSTILCDGVIGSKTIYSINMISLEFIPVFKIARDRFVSLIAAEDESQKKFLNGWVNRAYRDYR